MSNPIQLSIKFFGCLRKYNDESLSVHAIAGETASQIRQRLLALLVTLIPDFADHEVIGLSALSHAHHILAEDSEIVTSGELFVLPPVCGG